MQTDLFKCSYCSEPYDLELHIPKLLISCSHCLCLKCLKTTFTLYSPQRRQCPVCNTSLLPLTKTPEDFSNDPTIFQLLLQNQPKTKCGDCKEPDRKPALKVKQKNEREDLFQDKVRKKQKTAQEMDDQLIKMQEIITSQFVAMRKMLHTSQNIEAGALSEAGFELTKKEEQNDYHNESPLAEITNKLQEIFTETEGAFNRILKTKRSQTKKVLSKQIPQEKMVLSIHSSENEGEIKVKIEEGLSPMKASPYDNEEMEEEFSPEDNLQSQDNEKNQPILDEIQEMKKQIIHIEEESLLKLDFSEKDISETIFTHLCSEDFWDGIDKNKVFYLEVLEVNFSGSSLTDQQFIKFIQNLVIHMKNLTSILMNFARTKISSPSLQVLSDQCMKHHKLKSFILNCSQTSIGDEGFKSLDDGLNFSLETLENIELTLDSTDVDGEEFLDSLFGMSHLKHVKLSFDSSRITSEIVASVASCLSFIGKNLESLELNFNGTEISDKGLEKLSLSQMEKLKSFKLCLGGTFISNNFLFDFFKSLGSLATHLKTLELHLHSIEINNRGFKRFCEGVLSEMKNLESLKLDLSGTKITDMGLKNLILPSHKLQYLTLNLNGNKIHDSSLQSFKENNNFKNIKSINLQVGQTNVSDEALQGYETQASQSLNKDFVDIKDHSNKESKTKNGTKGFISKELDIKRNVLLELKNQLAIHYGSKADSSKFSSLWVSELIERLESKVYEKILRKVLTKILPIEKTTALEIEKWKRIIQKMIGSSSVNKDIEKNPINSNSRRKENHRLTERKQKNNADEIRSGKNHELSEVVLSFQWFQKYGQEISFREKVIEILKSMKTRTFFFLYQNLLDFIRELSKTYKSWKMPDKLKISTFSINWWQRYIRRDQELKKIWKNLPFSCE